MHIKVARMIDQGGRTRPTAPDLDADSPDMAVHGEPSLVDRPIFIVGCQRSGTTALRQTLDSHPRISAGPEEGALFMLKRSAGRLSRDRRRRYGISEEAWLEMVRRMNEDLMRPYAQSQGKTRWALKHPRLALAIPWLNEVYPDCQVVHIVRNPMDVISSNQRHYGPSRSDLYGKRWVRYAREAERDGTKLLGPERFKTIKYEDLATEPEKVLRDLVEWLGEPWSEQVLYSQAQTHVYPVRRKVNSRSSTELYWNPSSIGRGQKDAGLVSVLYVKYKCADMTARFGYDVRVHPSQARVLFKKKDRAHRRERDDE
jgi:Sulfotransferase family